MVYSLFSLFMFLPPVLHELGKFCAEPRSAVLSHGSFEQVPHAQELAKQHGKYGNEVAELVSRTKARFELLEKDNGKNKP